MLYVSQKYRHLILIALKMKKIINKMCFILIVKATTIFTNISSWICAEFYKIELKKLDNFQTRLKHNGY